MYKPTIGLEIHAELKTNTKLFCGCKNESNSEKPNTNICPICMGYPGAMPKINKQAIKNMIKIGLSVDGSISDFTEFDRKHYFYPDIPKGYQVSQYKHPIIKNGEINGIKITRIHLEEDTGKNSHLGESSLVDFNRSGIPLMELVTEPVITNALDAVSFAEALQNILRHLDVGLARMEWGEMRIEANISISSDENFGTKVEVKNLNSFKSVRDSIIYEINRQEKILDGKEKVKQETRGWDENTGKTFSQRLKESSEEYRYMPEPDLSKYYLNKLFDIDKIKKELPQLPQELYKKYTEDYGLNTKQAKSLINNYKIANIFNKVVINKNVKNIKRIANYITTDIFSYLSDYEENIYKYINEDVLLQLDLLLEEDSISSRGAKDTIEILIKEGGDVLEIIKKNNLLQLTDSESLKPIINKIINDNKKVVEDYKSGKESSLQFLVGLIMKETKGSANPTRAMELLKDTI